MNNKEAIEILKKHISPYSKCKADAEANEAINLAIKALEFTESQRICCDNCVNRNIKSKEACSSPFGVCEFFNDTPDRSFEIAQKSIELGRRLGRTEERVESKRPQGEWEDYSVDFWKCPECGYLLDKYCPRCYNKVILPKGGAE